MSIPLRRGAFIAGMSVFATFSTLAANPRQPAPQKDLQGWTLTRIPDGSGTVRLPQGYRIYSASNGIVDIRGDKGQIVELGVSLQVQTPQGAGVFANQLPFVAPYMDPVNALPTLTAPIGRMCLQIGQPGLKFTRVVEYQQIQAPANMQAAYIHYLFDRLPTAKPVNYEGFGLFITAPTGPTSWMYYFSDVSAPPEVFKTSLADMVDIMASWKIDDKVFVQRLRSAAASMNETSKIIQGCVEYRQKVGEKSNADWDEYIRGRRTVRNEATGEEHEVALGDARDAVTHLNEQGGGGTWREIPQRDK